MKLRRLELKDAPFMYEWMTDEDIVSNFRFFGSEIELKNIEQYVLNAQKDNENLHFAIVEDNDEYLGTISLKNVDMIDKNAEYAIVLRKKAIGKGVAKKATELVLEYAFDTIGLNKVYFNVLKNNKRAIRFYEKLGFKFEGEFKDHFFIKGKYETILWYRMLKDEFEY